MSDFWYVARNGQASGPFTIGQLQEQVAGGQLAPGDLVAAAGDTRWVPAVTVSGLFVVQAVAPPGPRVVQATCLGCFATVQIEVPAGSSSGNCPACGAENQFAEPDPAGPGPAAAFAGMEGDLQERIRQRVADAYAAAEQENAIVQGIFRKLIR